MKKVQVLSRQGRTGAKMVESKAGLNRRMLQIKLVAACIRIGGEEESK